MGNGMGKRRGMEERDGDEDEDRDGVRGWGR